MNRTKSAPKSPIGGRDGEMPIKRAIGASRVENVRFSQGKRCFRSSLQKLAANTGAFRRHATVTETIESDKIDAGYSCCRRTKGDFMTKGDGSIQQLDKNKWRVSVSFGTDPTTGKRQRVTKVIRGSKADARKARNSIAQDFSANPKASISRIEFSEYANQWLRRREKDKGLSERTLLANRQMVLKVSTLLEGASLPEVSPKHIEGILDALRESDLGETTVHDYFVLIRQIFKAAENDDLITKNPCSKLKTPKTAKSSRNSLSSIDVARLCAIVDDAKLGELSLCNDAYLIAVRLGIATGMRLGEVFALVWDNVNFSDRLIHVERSITNKGTIKPPKTDAGTRKIAVDKKTAERLGEWKKLQANSLLSIGVIQQEDTPVCCNGLGSYGQLNNFERWFRAWRQTAGFPNLKFHDLRHTQATHLIGAGFDVKTVQARLGHTSAATTLDMYSHALPENDRKAANLIEAVASGKSTEGFEC